MVGREGDSHLPSSLKVPGGRILGLSPDPERMRLDSGWTLTRATHGLSSVGN